MRGARITGWGLALPEKVVTNADFEARLDTTDEWIVDRTGIKERRYGGTTSSLAIEAAGKALARAGRNGADIDLLVLATTTPDRTVPATSSWVHHQLGCRGAAFDLNAACAGFVYGLVTAVALLDSGHDRVLLIGSDTLSQYTDQDDRSTAVLFGDGAGAIVVEAVGDDPLILAQDLGLDGSLTPILRCDRGGLIYMEGREVFRSAVRATKPMSRQRTSPCSFPTRRTSGSSTPWASASASTLPGMRYASITRGTPRRPLAELLSARPPMPGVSPRATSYSSPASAQA
jgi:3-oxoacyl-[acyl-carrier-protein] synthase-3